MRTLINLTESFVDAEEGEMAKGQMKVMCHNIKELNDMIEDEDDLPEWVQNKLTVANDYINTVKNYMLGQDHDLDEAAGDDELISAFLAKKKAKVVEPGTAYGANPKADAVDKYAARTARYAAMDAADEARAAKAKAKAEAKRIARNRAESLKLYPETAPQRKLYFDYLDELKALRNGSLRVSDAKIVTDPETYVKLKDFFVSPESEHLWSDDLEDIKRIISSGSYPIFYN